MLTVRDHNTRSYQETWQEMKVFTESRNQNTTDELWVLEHPPVYTQGQAGKAHHILNPGNIPVVQSDRGGQVTYHGPGQLVAYCLLDIRRRGIGIRSLVCSLEHVLISLLEQYDIQANLVSGAPGVYVGQEKIASIGLRVRNGCTYHGIALNVAMDLSPFNDINPCGFQMLKMTQMQHFSKTVSMPTVKAQFIQEFLTAFKR